jgi:hypothetical protein
VGSVPFGCGVAGALAGAVPATGADGVLRACGVLEVGAAAAPLAAAVVGVESSSDWLEVVVVALPQATSPVSSRPRNDTRQRFIMQAPSATNIDRVYVANQANISRPGIVCAARTLGLIQRRCSQLYTIVVVNKGCIFW